MLLIAGGTFFFAVGAIGLLRLPDVFTRIHATTKCDTLGAGLILAALMIHDGWSVPSLKVFMVLAFLWATNPAGSHLLARAVYRSGEAPVEVMDLTGTKGGSQIE
ncbi:MAG TPA: cation:proton antiporter [Clostridiales bacterium UBA8153]|nr:cation:proton antiporter [Clostridiales bacterium UBA8153]